MFSLSIEDSDVLASNKNKDYNLEQLDQLLFYYPSIEQFNIHPSKPIPKLRNKQGQLKITEFGRHERSSLTRYYYQMTDKRHNLNQLQGNDKTLTNVGQFMIYLKRLEDVKQLEVDIHNKEKELEDTYIDNMDQYRKGLDELEKIRDKEEKTGAFQPKYPKRLKKLQEKYPDVPNRPNVKDSDEAKKMLKALNKLKRKMKRSYDKELISFESKLDESFKEEKSFQVIRSNLVEFNKQYDVLHKLHNKVELNNEEDLNQFNSFLEKKKRLYKFYENFKSIVKNVIDIIDPFASLEKSDNTGNSIENRRKQRVNTTDQKRIDIITYYKPILDQLNKQNVYMYNENEFKVFIKGFEYGDDDGSNDEESISLSTTTTTRISNKIDQSGALQGLHDNLEILRNFWENNNNNYNKEFYLDWQELKNQCEEDFKSLFIHIYSINGLVNTFKWKNKLNFSTIDELKIHILQNVFNGRTQLKIIKGGQERIIVQIHSPNLVIPIVHKVRDEVIETEDFLIFPNERYQKVSFIVNLNRDNAKIIAIYPIINRHVNIEYDSPLRQKQMSISGQLHYGLISNNIDHKWNIHAFKHLESILISDDNKGMSKFFIKNVMKKKIIQEFNELSPLITLDALDDDKLYNIHPDEHLNESEKNNEIDPYSKDLYLCLPHKRLIRMIYKGRKDKPGFEYILSFDMNNNTHLTTYTIDEINAMDKPKVYNVTDNDFLGDNNPRVILFNEKGLRLPHVLSKFITDTKDIYDESKLANDLYDKYSDPSSNDNGDIFLCSFITSLYSYFIHYMELERVKYKRLTYGTENKVYDGYIDDWSSLCHLLTIPGKCLFMIYSTFSLHQRVLRLKIGLTMSKDYWNQ